MFEKINVRMLGGFSVTADGKILADTQTKLTKPWQLFCYLVLHKDRVTPAEVLLQEIWGNENLTDPQNVLKNTIYALRRSLAGHVKPGETPILYRAGGYCLNGHIKWRVDVDRFVEHCAAAERCRGDVAARTAAWKKAETVFRGELLPRLSGEMWVKRAQRELAKKYLRCIQEMSSGLFELNKYDEVLRVTVHSMRIVPLNEPVMLLMFRALHQLRLYSEIVVAYNKLARLFEAETRRPLCDEIRSIYRDAAKSVDKPTQDFTAFCEELAEVLKEKNRESGAFYCSYEGLKQMYAITARNVRGKVIVPMMITVLVQEQAQEDGRLCRCEAMDDLRLAISAALRKSDVFAKYSQNQYVALLCLTDAKEAEGIRTRLLTAYESTGTHEEVRLDIRTPAFM